MCYTSFKSPLPSLTLCLSLQIMPLFAFFRRCILAAKVQTIIPNHSCSIKASFYANKQMLEQAAIWYIFKSFGGQ